MIGRLLSVLIVLFGAWVGMMLPSTTVATVLLLALSAMCIGMGVERAREVRGRS